MTINTIKTVFGFCVSLLRKYRFIKRTNGGIDGIYNYHLISNNVATSGQPTAAQFSLIKEAGYSVVINLAPHNAENSLANEASLLRELCLHYIHIPVDFKSPEKRDFEKFVTAMNDSLASKVWVHCAANMRVSAFMYKYRCEVLNEHPQKVQLDLKQIWEPFGVWREFIKSA